MNVKTIEEAMGVLLSSLNDTQKAELRQLVMINYRTTPGHDWINYVISMFALSSDEATLLIGDIDRQYPGESLMKEIESDTDQPVFEAKVLLHEAQRRLNNGY